MITIDDGMPALLFTATARDDHPMFGKTEDCRPHVVEVYDGNENGEGAGWTMWRCLDCGMSTTFFLNAECLVDVRAGRGREVFADDIQ